MAAMLPFSWTQLTLSVLVLTTMRSRDSPGSVAMRLRVVALSHSAWTTTVAVAPCVAAASTAAAWSLPRNTPGTWNRVPVWGSQ